MSEADRSTPAREARVYDSIALAPTAAAYGVGPARIGGRDAWSDGTSWTLAPRKKPAVTGILPYGSTDPSVVLRHPLTYAPTAAELRYGTLSIIGDAEGPTYHSTKGMKPRSPTLNAFSGLAFTSPDTYLISKHEELSVAGQIRFDVERLYLGGTNALTGVSGAYTPAANEVAVSLTKDGSGAKPLYALWKQTTTAILCQGLGVNTGSSLAERRTQTYSTGSTKVATFDSLFNVSVGRTPTTDETVSTASIFNHGSANDFVEVVASWNGGATGAITIYLDGIPFGGKIGNAAMPNMLEALVIGAADKYSTFPMGGYYIRNLQLSTKPVTLSLDGATKRISILSDSIIGCNSYAIDVPRQNMILHRIQKALVRSGRYYETIYISTNGGHTMSAESSAQNFITTTNDANFKPRERVKNTNPTLVVINGTGNDMGSCTDQQYINALIDHLDYFFNIGAYSSASGTPAEAAVITTIHDRTSFSSNNRTQSQSINTLLRAFVSMYSNLRPQMAGRVVLADTWGAMNGTMDYTGKLSDGTHPGWLGYCRYGDCLGAAIVDASLAVDGY